MISGKLATSAIPARWNELFTELFGITPPNDAQGCLQDIHWSFAAFGYFPTYQLGNLYAAQIFDAAQQALPELEEQIRRGELRPLREWLRENVHQHGMRYRAKDLIEHVTGQPPSPQPFIDYVERKFKPLYGV
jgi:carboxypeptidase Taq